ncbi:MAG: hypothetical protein N3F04_06950 [Candidatus Nezhaarchaeota archaeon]|nr:hypothetical protein [Candidatus Nezhaarchaeota archaeon]
MHPQSIFSMLYTPGRNLGILYIETSAGLSIKELTSILRELDKYGAIIFRGLYHEERVNEARKTYLCMVCDLTSSKHPLEEVASSINKLPGIKSVEVVKPETPGFIVDERHYPLIVVDERALIFRIETFNVMLLGIRQKWGATGQVFLYYLGYEGGIGAAKFYKRVSDLPPNEAIKAALKVATAHGLGKFEVIDLDMERPYVVVRVYDLFECIPMKGKSDQPFSEFYRGLLCGTLSELLGVKLRAEERACVAKGDPYCEFVLMKEEVAEA